MEPHYRFRIYILTVLIIFGFGTLLTRLHSFQIVRRDEFQAQVPGGRTVTVREPGVRGEITDRNGIALARNLRSYEVTFNLEEIYRSYRQQHDEAPSIDRITTESGMPRKRSEQDIVAIVNEWTIASLTKLGLAKNYNAGALRTHYLTHGGLVPFTYRADLTYEEFAKFAEHNLDLPGVYLSTRPQREYPYGSLASHVLGIVKEWDKGDVPDAAARKFDHYVGDEKGDGGIEGTMNNLLRGVEGKKTISKDEKGVVTGMFDNVPPGAGATVELAIDARIQFLAENTMRRVGRGAAVVMDVETGEVLAMASVPDFDLNAFIPSITQKRLNDYKQNKLSPFTNRALASFAPGSTFKIPTAISGAIQGMATKSFTCNGYIPYGNHKIGCWIYNMHGGSHGTLTLPLAIKQSCNPYFNTLANAIGWRAMVDGFTMMGFGQKTGIELPNEDPGVLPGSREWRAKNPSGVMTPVETAFLSIGQGNAMATPLQLCTMVSCVANGGRYYYPRIVKKVTASDGKVLVEDKPKLKIDITTAGVKPSDMDLIRKGMWLAVNEAGGTAGRVKLPNVEVAAKSGTAQTSDNGKKSNNSWIISFAPFDKPKYAVCVLVQNGGSGGGVCGPLVNLIYRGLFAQDDGMKLPLRPQTEYGGNTDRYEKVALPDDILAAIDATAGDEATAGETGEEVGVVPAEVAPAPTKAAAPSPTITTDPDEEGIIPRAKPIREH